MAKSSKLKAVPKPVYDPRKQYEWQAEDVFPISGLQLDIINKVINQHLQDPAVQKALALVEGAKVVQAILAEGVADGIIKEIVKKEEPAK
jgi:hypothetical protein